MTMDHHENPLLPRLAKAAVLALGFATIWGAVAIWLGSTVLNSGIGEEVPLAERLRVASDGTPIIESYPVDDYSRRAFRALAGREMPEGAGVQEINPLYLAGQPRGWPDSLDDLPWASRIKPFSNERDAAAIWYFVQDAGSKWAGSFVGYERVTNRVIGRIGLAGFRDGPIPDDERIPVSSETSAGMPAWSSLPISLYSITGWSSQTLQVAPGDVPPRLVHVPSGEVLRVVDLDDGTVRTGFQSPEPIVSAAVPYLSGYFGRSGTDGEGGGRSILVRTPRRVFRLDHSYKIVGAFDIPPEVSPAAPLSWHEARDGSAVVTFDPPTPDMLSRDHRKRRVTVYEVAADGALRKTTSVDLGNGSYVASGRVMLGLIAAGVPSPAPLLAIGASMAAFDPDRGYPAALGSMLTASLPGLAAVAALATLLAAAAWRKGLSYGMPTRERAAWAVFVGLFGLPGWVGFRLHRGWPPHAAGGGPSPARATTGTEIFA